MGFETIIGIVVVILSVVLTSKDKKNQKTRQRKNWQTSTTTSSQPMKRQENNPRKGAFGGSLEDLFKELRTEFEKNYGVAKKEEVESTTGQDVSRTSNMEVNREERVLYKANSYLGDSSTLDRNSVDSKGTVYDKEIGKNEKEFELDKKGILQGIIMSEVLQKPKSLRR